jgi:hypothetical protein
METIRNIKVTAHYEVDTKPSKFDALFAEYQLAKAIADATESTKQPLIDAMGEKKWELIHQQLDVIVQRLDVIAQCQGQFAQVVARSDYEDRGYSVTIRRSNRHNSTTIYIDGYQQPQPWWFEEKGIVTLWNQLGLYEQLEEKCEILLIQMINAENSKTERINNNYNNMIK